MRQVFSRAWPLMVLLAGTATAAAPDAAQLADADDGTTPLHWAVYRNDLAEVKRLIGAGADVNAQNDYGATPLSEAAVAGNVEVIDRLLKAGAKVDAANADGQTALMIIARTSNVEAARLLLKRGAKVDQPPGCEWLPTFWQYSVPDQQYPNAEAGNYCVYCHASAQGEATFAVGRPSRRDRIHRHLHRDPAREQAAHGLEHAHVGLDPGHDPLIAIDLAKDAGPGWGIGAREVKIDHSREPIGLEQHVVPEEIGVDHPARQFRPALVRLKPYLVLEKARFVSGKKGHDLRHHRLPPLRTTRIFHFECIVAAGNMHCSEHLSHLSAVARLGVR